MVGSTRQTNNDEDAVYKKAIDKLLERIGVDAVVGNEDDYAAFRADIARLREDLGAEPTPETILMTVGSATQALGIYNRGITTLLKRQSRELQAIISTVSEMVGTIAGENARSVARLHEIGERLEATQAITDLSTLKRDLGECLGVLKQETLRQKEQSDSAVLSIRQELDRRSSRASASSMPEELDQATGLPTKDACLDTMKHPTPAGQRRYVAILVVSGLQAINSRFGYPAGDRMLRGFGQFFQTQIKPTDQLFRWRGPAFVGLLDRTETLEQVRTQIKRTAEQRIEETFEIDGRLLTFPVSAAWSVFQLITTVASAERQIEMFIASQGIPRGRE